MKFKKSLLVLLACAVFHPVVSGDDTRFGVVYQRPTTAVTPFNPLTLSPLLWLKADAGLYQDAAKTTAANNADPVGVWADQSGYGNDCSTTTTRRPTATSGALGGMTALAFDGSNDSCSGNLNLTSTNHATFVIVAQNITQAAGGAFAVNRAGVADSNDPGCAIVWYSAGGTDVTYYKFNPGGTFTVPANGTPFIYVSDSNGATSNTFLNGTAQSPVSQDSSNFNVTRYTLGARHDGTSPGSYMHLYISEVFVFDSSLSTANRQALTSYLGTKYGITVN